MSDNKDHKQPASPRKLAANRKNAKCSTGPRTPKGKQRASQNSYKHGFFGTRLFPTNELIAKDWADYQRIYTVYWDHYSPVGDLEKLCVEKIAVQALRLTRLFGHEQKVLAWVAPFESRSVDKIVRYESNVSRQLEKEIDRLERLQEEREAESSQFEPPDFEEPQDGSTSSNPPPPDDRVPNAGAGTLAEAVEQAVYPTPAEQPKSGLGSAENYGTDPIGSSRWVETLEDAELIERIKRENDLEQLE